MGLFTHDLPRWVFLVITGINAAQLVESVSSHARRGSLSLDALLPTQSLAPKGSTQSVHEVAIKNLELSVWTLVTSLGAAKAKAEKHVSLMLSTMPVTMKWYVPKLW